MLETRDRCRYFIERTIGRSTRIDFILILSDFWGIFAAFFDCRSVQVLIELF